MSSFGAENDTSQHTQHQLEGN